MRDPYSILGVGKSAGPQEIKAAWRATAKALHPDQNPDDPHAARRFTEAGRAYDLLKDPTRRRMFDEALARANNGGARGKEKTFMEQRAERSRQEAEARAAAEVRAAAEAKETAEARAKTQAAQAARPQPTREEAAEAEEVVAKIFGTSKSPDDREPAPAHGEQRTARHGEEPQPQPERHSDPYDPRPSPALDLIGYLLKRLTRTHPAPEKAPDLTLDVQVSIEDVLNRVTQTAMLPDGTPLTVKMPTDAKDGTQIRLEGLGHRLPHIKRGDVVATLRLKPHRWYRHHGYDLLTFVDIDIENAVLGCEASVETPDGESKITIPPWTSSNYKHTIAGKGLPKGHGMRGNLIVEVRVLLWDRPDQKIIDLMRSMREGLYL